MIKIFIYITLFFSLFTFSQNTIKGKVTAKNEALAFTNIYINELQQESSNSLKIDQNTQSNTGEKILFYRRKIFLV